MLLVQNKAGPNPLGLKRSFRQLVARILLCMFFALQVFLAAPFSALSENINYCGLKLSVDSIQVVDSSNIKVKLGADQRIISNSSLEHWVVEKNLLDSNAIKNISTSELVSFVSLCSQSEASEVVLAALREIYLRADYTKFSAQNYVASADGNIDLLKAILAERTWEQKVRHTGSPTQMSLLAEAILEILVSDPEWLKVNALRLFYLLSEPINLQMFERVREELESGQLGYLDRLSYALSIIGDQSSKSALFLKEAALLAPKLISKQIDPEFLKSTSVKLQKSDQLTDLLYPKLSSIIIETAKEYLRADKLNEALNLIGFLLPLRPSPDALEIVRSVLDKLIVGPEIVIDPLASQLFMAYSKVDPELKRRYLSLLDIIFEREVSAGHGQATEELLFKVTELRPDPSEENDSMRFKQALLYSEQGLTAESTRKLSQIEGGIGMFRSVKLFFGTGDFLPVFFAALLLFSFIAILWKFVVSTTFNGLHEKADRALQSFFQSRPAASNSNEEELSDPDPATASFVKLAPDRAISAVAQEYKRRLEQFGLSGNVSLRAIKSAYRTAVKECHPDLNPNQNEVLTQEFLKLTRLYDELLEIRKELGMSD